MSYIYMFIRRDMTPEQRIVQIGHACYEAGKKFQDDCGISSMVLLEAEDEADIENISRKLVRRGIDHYKFHEPDDNWLTGVTMGYSAICTRPIVDDSERAFFRKWKLFRHNSVDGQVVDY